jgi:hypothetical protein
LEALLTYRGPGKSNAATGGWSIFQDHSFSQNALDFITTQKGDGQEKSTSNKPTNGVVKPGPGRPKRAAENTETPEAKRRKEIAAGRFGTSAQPDDGQGLERFEVRMLAAMVFNEMVILLIPSRKQPTESGEVAHPYWTEQPKISKIYKTTKAGHPVSALLFKAHTSSLAFGR